MSSIRRFISARTSREFALNMDHVISLKRGLEPKTVEFNLTGYTLRVCGDFDEVLEHIAQGTAMTNPPYNTAISAQEPPSDDPTWEDA